MSPWRDISKPEVPEKLITRRVDRSTDVDLFWFRTHQNQIGFLLRLPEGLTSAVRLPIFREITVVRLVEAGREQLRWTLLDKGFEGVFQGFAEYVVRETLQASPVAQAQVALACTDQWKRLLRSSQSPLLSKSEQVGLLGELRVLKLLLSEDVPEAEVVDGWQGPRGQARDIVIRDVAVEVKARTAASRDTVQISSEFQLQVEPQRQLWLVAVDVEADPASAGESLNTHVEHFLSLFVSSGHRDLLLAKLMEAGYHEEHDYNGQNWTVLGETWWSIDDAFPGVTPVMLPHAVSDVKYRLSTSRLEDFRSDAGAVASAILGEA